LLLTSAAAVRVVGLTRNHDSACCAQDVLQLPRLVAERLGGHCVIDSSSSYGLHGAQQDAASSGKSLGNMQHYVLAAVFMNARA
jgi:hypothetical protein